jgi:thiol-disulfide isomerase/thioredoxin
MGEDLRNCHAGRARTVRLVASLLFGSLLVGSAAEAKERLQVGDVPPDNLGRASSGGKVKLTDYRGKIVIISFWASWCPPCRKELPILVGIQKQATRERLVAFAVNWKERSDRYHELLKRMKDVDLTFVSDESGYLGGEYGVKAIPHMIIIDRDGRIAAVHVGYGEGELPKLVAEINRLLAEPLTAAAAEP